MNKLSLFVIALGSSSFILACYSLYENYDSAFTGICFIFAVLIYLFAIWQESYSARIAQQKAAMGLNETSEAVSEALNATSSIREKIESHTKEVVTLIKKYRGDVLADIQKCHVDLARNIETFNPVKDLLSDHCELLEDIQRCKVKYDSNPIYKEFFEKYIQHIFSDSSSIGKTITTCKNDLERFSFKLQPLNVSLAYLAHDLCWSSVPPGGTIFATSIVKNFWKDAARYLREQEKLIRDKNVTIVRCFIIIEQHSAELNELENAIRRNVEIGVDTRVAFAQNEGSAGNMYRDIGIVNNNMNQPHIALTNIVGQDREIVETLLCLNPRKNVTEFILNEETKNAILEHPFTIKFNDYPIIDEGFRDANEMIDKL